MKSKENELKKSALIIPREKFKESLEKGIEEGNKILAIKVTQYLELNYGFGKSPKFKYNEEEKDAFIKSCNEWIEYYIEFLKSAFNLPNSEYRNDFAGRGVSRIFTTDYDIIPMYRKEIKAKIECLESLVKRVSLIPIDNSISVEDKVESQEKETNSDSKKIFIVHGHDSLIRTETELLIKDLGYEPIVLFKQPNRGSTIMEKLEREAKNVAFAIILYTPCDRGGASSESDLRPRARQNVVFEHGLMCGKLGRRNVAAIVSDNVEVPGDLSGVVYIKYDEQGAWKYQLSREMKAAGLNIDLNRIN